MPASSPEAPATASNPTQAMLRLVAQRLSATPLDQLATAISKSDSVASRIRSGEANCSLDDAVRLMVVAGLKVVPADKVCVDRETYEAFMTIATKAMAAPDVVRRLTWDD